MGSQYGLYDVDYLNNSRAPTLRVGKERSTSPSHHQHPDQLQSLPLDFNTGGHSDTLQFQIPSFLTPVMMGAPTGPAFQHAYPPRWFDGTPSGALSSSTDASAFFKQPFKPLPHVPSAGTSSSSTAPPRPFMYGVPSPTRDNVQPQPPRNDSSPQLPPDVGALPSPQEPLALPSNIMENAPPLYSTTGFDMLDILARVASRQNQTISLGPVDLSCSFVVVDVHKFDHPIVYASPSFYHLTGYDQTEVIGRNCRFLQSPNGHIEKGAKRDHSPEAIAHIKTCLSANKECQAHVMNFRKDGVPFVNLVTVIPLPYEENPHEIQYHVGFQVDLVRQPAAILQTMQNGSYYVNYSRTQVARGPRAAVAAKRASVVEHEVLPRKYAEVLSAVRAASETGASDNEVDGWTEFNSMLVEQSDDFVHVLSVKGILQYASPPFLRALEYTQDEIVGHHVEKIAHPQDLIPVTRELKEASIPMASLQAGSLRMQKTLNLLFRVKRKHSGMIWIESTGRLLVEPGKSRKSIVFSGRLRTLPELTWDAIERSGGLGRMKALDDRSCFWIRVSTATGLIISAETAVHSILGTTSDDLVGTPLRHILTAEENGQRAIDAINSCSTRKSGEYPVIVDTTLRSGVTGVLTPVDMVLYPPTSSLAPPPPPPFLMVQFRIRSPSSFAPRKGLKVVTAPSNEAVYHELRFKSDTNWNYEAETIRQNNEMMTEKIEELIGPK